MLSRGNGGGWRREGGGGRRGEGAQGVLYYGAPYECIATPYTYTYVSFAIPAFLNSLPIT